MYASRPHSKEGVALFKAEKISESLNHTTYKISLNEKELFNLMGTNRGITAEPILATPENLKGYNFTYIIGKIKPDFEAPLLEVKTINSDQRGSISVVLFKGVEIYNMLATNRGYARGGHNHNNPVKFVDVYSEAPIVWYIEKSPGKWETIIQREGGTVEVAGGQNHYVVALGASLKSELPKEGPKGEPFQATNDSVSRAIVDRINARQKEVDAKLVRN